MGWEKRNQLGVGKGRRVKSKSKGQRSKAERLGNRKSESGFGVEGESIGSWKSVGTTCGSARTGGGFDTDSDGEPRT